MSFPSAAVPFSHGQDASAGVEEDSNSGESAQQAADDLPAGEAMEEGGGFGGGGYGGGGYGGEGGYGDGGYGGMELGGGYGAMEGGEGYGSYGGDMMGGAPSFPLNILLVTKAETDGKTGTQLKALKAMKVNRYRYQIGSFAPQDMTPQMAGMMGGGYGMEGGYGGGGYGGMMGAEGGMGAGMTNESATPPPESIQIYVFSFDRQSAKGRTQVEVCVKLPRRNRSRRGAGMGMMSGFEITSEVALGGGEEVEMGSAMESRAQYVPLELAEKLTNAGGKPLTLQPSSEELNLVADMLRQRTWRAEVLEQIQSKILTGPKLEGAEESLKEIMSEEYDTQLARQEFEITAIEQSAQALRHELKRRRDAKQRVIDVQWGRIVLEAQGLLSK
ncbi:hypothetical protein [Aureliella helgolandensis]|nr:hypothetical protein [Aureliella helgolandensis]